MTMDVASDVQSRFYSTYMSYFWKFCSGQHYAGDKINIKQSLHLHVSLPYGELVSGCTF